MKKKNYLIAVVTLLSVLTGCNREIVADNSQESTTVSVETVSTTSEQISTTSEAPTSETLPSTPASIGTSVTSSDKPIVVEGSWQYFIQNDSSASRDFMRTPYIEGVAPSVDVDSYYASAIGKKGKELKDALKTIANVSNIARSYDWSRFKIVDEDPNNTNNVFCIYNRASYGKEDTVSGNTPYRWNREHTYPDSKISNNAAKDSQLIFADDWKTNNARSNYVFGEVTHSSSTAVKDSANRVTACYLENKVFEPCDAAKGEVARASLYTYIMYDHQLSGNFKDMQLCLKWNREFPVTSWEILRNNRNYSVQKNRNPFIDHPEFADLLF